MNDQYAAVFIKFRCKHYFNTNVPYCLVWSGLARLDLTWPCETVRAYGRAHLIDRMLACIPTCLLQQSRTQIDAHSLGLFLIG